ncbi:MAG: c-type cytochrome [Mycobacterium leprae]
MRYPISNKPLHTILTLAGLAAVLAGCSLAPSGSASSSTYVPGDAARGQVVFGADCAKCHGADAKGIAGSGKSLVDGSKRMKQPDGKILDFLKLGHPKMERVVPEESLRDAIAYLHTIAPK